MSAPQKSEAQENLILFTSKDGTTIYQTGMMPDTELTQRLLDAGVSTRGEIIEETSPWLYFLLTWGLPMILLIGFGQFMSKKMMDKAGGPNSMMFGLGKSNAKIYVKSSERHQILPMWRARTKPRRASRRSWSTCTTRQSTQDIGASHAEGHPAGRPSRNR